jgi:glycosyltransferase involved in cell wall biosynthesis
MLAGLQRSHAIHLCPSESEGFGHTIVEGLSAGAVVVTVDAPPMNELVTPETGILLGWDRSEPMRASTRYFANPAGLDRAVASAVTLPAELRMRLGSAARERFLEIDREFRQAFARAVGEVLQEGGRRQR